MSAYLIVMTEVTEPNAFADYVARSAEPMAAHGAKYLARGGRTVTLEGEAATTRNTVIEFPSLEAAERWYNSPEYQDVKGLRDGAANMRLFVVEGL